MRLQKRILGELLANLEFSKLNLSDELLVWKGGYHE